MAINTLNVKHNLILKFNAITKKKWHIVETQFVDEHEKPWYLIYFKNEHTHRETTAIEDMGISSKKDNWKACMNDIIQQAYFSKIIKNEQDYESLYQLINNSDYSS